MNQAELRSQFRFHQYKKTQDSHQYQQFIRRLLSVNMEISPVHIFVVFLCGVTVRNYLFLQIVYLRIYNILNTLIHYVYDMLSNIGL